VGLLFSLELRRKKMHKKLKLLTAAVSGPRQQFRRETCSKSNNK
jgi:hypothetical protein